MTKKVLIVLGIMLTLGLVAFLIWKKKKNDEKENEKNDEKENEKKSRALTPHISEDMGDPNGILLPAVQMVQPDNETPIIPINQFAPNIQIVNPGLMASINQPVTLSSSPGINSSIRISRILKQVEDSFSYKYVALGTKGQESGIFLSKDGNNWGLKESGNFKSIIYANSLFVAPSDTGIFTSPDGETWTSKESGNFSDIIYANSLFVALDRIGIFTSPDGETWTSKESESFSDIIYANSLFVAITKTGIFTSPDGETWTEATDTDLVLYSETFDLTA